MLCADKLGKAPFKLENPRPHPALIGQDSTSQDFDSRIDLFLSKKRLVDPDQFPQFFSWPPVFSNLRSGAYQSWPKTNPRPRFVKLELQNRKTNLRRTDSFATAPHPSL